MKLSSSGAKSSTSLSLTVPKKIKLAKSNGVLRKFAEGGIVPRARDTKIIVRKKELVLSGEPEEPHLVRRD